MDKGRGKRGPSPFSFSDAEGSGRFLAIHGKLERVGWSKKFGGQRSKKLGSEVDFLVAYAAEEGVKAIEGAVKKMKARLFPYDIEAGVFLLGNMACVHGYSFGESALRDHCEQYGRPVLMAHTHQIGRASCRERV